MLVFPSLALEIQLEYYSFARFLYESHTLIGFPQAMLDDSYHISQSGLQIVENTLEFPLSDVYTKVKNTL